jgi:hypothetical protein
MPFQKPATSKFISQNYKNQTSQHLKSPKTYLKIQIFIFAPSDLGLRTMRQAIAALNLRTSGETRHPKRGFEQSLNHPKISKNWVSTIATRVFTIIKWGFSTL